MLASASRVSRRVIVPSQSRIQCIDRVGSEKGADAMFEHVLGHLLKRLVAAENVILCRPRSGCNIQLGLQWLEIIRIWIVDVIHKSQIEKKFPRLESRICTLT